MSQNIMLTSANTDLHSVEFGELVRGARHEAYALLGNDFIDEMHDPDGGYPEYFASVIENARWARVMLVGGEVAGIAVTETVVDRPDALRLGYLYVDPKRQGQDFRSELLDDAVTFATESGFKKLGLYVHSGNNLAISLYEDRGFRHSGTLSSPYY